MENQKNKNNVISVLTRKFSLRIIKLYHYLLQEKKEFVMSKQIYRSGTSIGANIAESVYAQSDADYLHKLRLSLKEASETEYWLDLLMEAGFINDVQYESIVQDLKIIIGTIINIINKIIARMKDENNDNHTAE